MPGLVLSKRHSDSDYMTFCLARVLELSLSDAVVRRLLDKADP